MPELPEVETVKRTLTPLLLNRRILAVRAEREVVIKHPLPADFAARLSGRQISGLGRRGKYLLLLLDDGQTLAAHLRMTGRLLCTPADLPPKPHTHVVFSLDDGQELRFSDARRFGCLWLLAPGEQDTYTGMAGLGPEPFDSEFSWEYLQARLGGRRSPVKNGILDQHVLAGLGNIYADECLFLAGLRPERPCSSLSAADWQALARQIPAVLTASIANNGTTFNDFLDGQGREGQNMPHLWAYGRAGLSCKRCGSRMEKTRVGGRGTCYCPQCQH